VEEIRMKPLLLISVPRSGSHMMAQALRCRSKPNLWLGENNSIKDIAEGVRNQLKDRAWAHLPYDPLIEKAVFESYKAVVFLRRDPRDVVVSAAHYVHKESKSKKKQHVLDQEVRPGRYLSDMNLKCRMDWLIEHFKPYRYMTGWVNTQAYQLRYEDVIIHRNETCSDLRGWLIRKGIGVLSEGEFVAATTRKHRYFYRTGTTGEHKQVFDEGQWSLCNKHLSSMIRAWHY
jgi:hypothetical protein